LLPVIPTELICSQAHTITSWVFLSYPVTENRSI